MMTQVIDRGAARALAEVAARNALAHVVPGRVRYLSNRCAQGEHCWFFFRDDAIVVPAEQALECDAAYAVSRWGDVRQIADLSTDPDRLREYLAMMSGFFLRGKHEQVSGVAAPSSGASKPIGDIRRNGWTLACPQGHRWSATLLKQWGGHWAVWYDLEMRFVAVAESNAGLACPDEAAAAVMAALADHGLTSICPTEVVASPHCPSCGIPILSTNAQRSAGVLWIEGQLLVDLAIGRLSRLAAVDVVT